MNKLSKKTLKEGYYWESENFYNSLPATLPKPKKYKTEIFTEWISHRDILKKYAVTPYPDVTSAASVVLDLIPSLEKSMGRLVYFNHNNVLHRFVAWRGGDGQLSVGVDEVGLGRKFDPEYGVCFSNGPLEPLTPGPSDTLKLSNFVQELKDLIKKYE